MNADNAILTSAIVTVGSTFGAAILPESMGGKGQLEHSRVRMLIGTGLTFTALAFLAEIAPAIAVPLSACIAITALLWYGIPILDKVFNAN